MVMCTVASHSMGSFPEACRTSVEVGAHGVQEWCLKARKLQPFFSKTQTQSKARLDISAGMIMCLSTEQRMDRRQPGSCTRRLEGSALGTISITCKSRAVSALSLGGVLHSRAASTTQRPLLVAKCICSSRAPIPPGGGAVAPSIAPPAGRGPRYWALLRLLGPCSLCCLPPGCASAVSESSACRRSWSGRSASGCSSPARGWLSTDIAWSGSGWSASGWSASACAWSTSAGASRSASTTSARSCGANRSCATSRSGGPPCGGPTTTGGKPRHS